MQITLDKPRNLRFNVNSLAWLEAELCEPGKTGEQFLQWLSKQLQDEQDLKKAAFPGFRTLRALLWACLRHEDKSLTIDRVGELMTSAMTGEVLVKCIEAMNEFFAEGNQVPLSLDSADSNGGVSAGTTLN